MFSAGYRCQQLRGASDAGEPPAGGEGPLLTPSPQLLAQCSPHWRKSAGSIERVKECFHAADRTQRHAELLQNARTIAMVGASDRPDRASYGVMRFLQQQGYRVIPVNPASPASSPGEYMWRELSQIGEPIDIVDISASPRRSARSSMTRLRWGETVWSNSSRGCGCGC